MRLSVVMPARNVGPYIDACVQSILGQTFRDFEFVIRDDGSLDDTRQILRRWSCLDKRIRLFESDTSLGPAASSDWVIKQARGNLIARMDGDDIAHPDRLRRQIEALSDDPEACLVGCLWEGIDDKGRLVRPRDRWRLAHPGPFAPFPHGSVMFRREAYERVGGYRAEADFWEDLDLYRRLGSVGKIIVLPAPLYRHRCSLLSTRLTSDQERVEASVDRMYRSVPGTQSEPQTGKRLPRVFISIGSTRLWAGRSPEILVPLLKRAELRRDRQTVLSLLWAMWGALSPLTLRWVLRKMVRLRDMLAAGRIREEGVYRWSGDWESDCTPAPSEALCALHSRDRPGRFRSEPAAAEAALARTAPSGCGCPTFDAAAMRPLPAAGDQQACGSA